MLGSPWCLGKSSLISLEQMRGKADLALSVENEELIFLLLVRVACLINCNLSLNTLRNLC